ncbi:uncharacterized protein TNCV_1511721 [Trichonephila clavipes]|nr:uncharacterized protein TNCV_1511721 [Trichonephila clavipes]
MWVAEWNEIVFTDESRICLQHPDGRIRVWRHRGERMLNSCIMHRHTSPASSIMGLATAIFQQDNARPHVARIAQKFFVNHQIGLLLAGSLSGSFADRKHVVHGCSTIDPDYTPRCHTRSTLATLSYERDEPPIVAEALGPSPVDPCLNPLSTDVFKTTKCGIQVKATSKCGHGSRGALVASSRQADARYIREECYEGRFIDVKAAQDTLRRSLSGILIGHCRRENVLANSETRLKESLGESPFLVTL